MRPGAAQPSGERLRGVLAAEPFQGDGAGLEKLVLPDIVKALLIPENLAGTLPDRHDIGIATAFA